MGIFSELQLESIRVATSSEIVAAKKQAKALLLGIDAIKFVKQVPSGYVYNLLLSKSIHMSADQPLAFQLKGGATIQAVVLSCSDEGITVVCSQKLSEDAVVMNVMYDPSFILVQLRMFLEAKMTQVCPLAEKIIQRKLDPPQPCVIPSQLADLNPGQRKSVAQMDADVIHLLWGPPGTGKTHTLGVAIARWIEQRKSVLLVSTSNAAVDVAMQNVLKGLKAEPNLVKCLHRLGNSDHLEVGQLTKNNPAAALLVGCTVAKMVLDIDLRSKSFDIVIVDEASMVSLLYAVAAATLAQSRLVYGGDFMQLPPICQSGNAAADEWFGKSVYDWLGINLDTSPVTVPISMLQTQYRMTNQIGDLVSHLCYRDKLIHGRNIKGAPVEFVDVPIEWRETFYSVPEKSYYHPLSIPIIGSLVDALAAGERNEFLLLTPFRSQQALLGALAFDLRERYNGHTFASSTIHRSQGGERRVVILDLTTHCPTKMAKFFKNANSERLLNVGLSRARDHLVVIGNQEMVLALAEENPFWEKLLDKWNDVSVYSAAEIFDAPSPFSSIELAISQHMPTGIPSICSYRPDGIPLERWTKLLTAIASPRKLLILPTRQPIDGGFIVREDSDSPPLFVGNGYLCLPVEGGWTITYSPNVGRVIWRIGFKHLADEEVKPAVAEKVFQCPMCAPGKLVMKMKDGQLRLVCNNELFRCFYNRALSRNEAAMKIRLAGVTCCAVHQHPMTVRQNDEGGGLFMGCENHPVCQCPPKSLRLIEGM